MKRRESRLTLKVERRFGAEWACEPHARPTFLMRCKSKRLQNRAIRRERYDAAILYAVARTPPATLDDVQYST